MKKFIFYVKTNPTFIPSLEKELKVLGIQEYKRLSKTRLNYIKFESELPKIWEISVKSRIIESLKIEIVNDMKVDSERLYKSKLKSVDFSSYLPIKRSTEFKLPSIKAYCYRSKLFHEGMIEKITTNYLNKLAFNINEDDNRKEKLLINEKDNETLKNQLIEKTNLKELPRIDIIIQNDKAIILLDLFSRPLHQHGYKLYKNWGTLRETYAASLIYLSQLTEKNKILIWDPFCGSGTFLIETLMIILEKPVRDFKSIQNEIFTELPFHDENNFKIFLSKQNKISKKFEFDLKKLNKEDLYLIGSDIDAKSVDSCVKNLEFAKFYQYKFTNSLNNEINNNISLNPNIFNEKVNKCFEIFMGDFESIAKNIIFNKFSNKKFNIITNLPYGESMEMNERLQIKSLYKKFGKFLRKYNNLLGEIYILVKKRNIQDDLNFHKLTELKWKIVCEFVNNGIEVEFLKLEKIN